MNRLRSDIGTRTFAGFITSKCVFPNLFSKLVRVPNDFTAVGLIDPELDHRPQALESLVLIEEIEGALDH